MRDFVDDCIVDSEEQDLSTQFLQMPKNQLIDEPEPFERYCNVMPVFGFNSAIYDLNLIKYCLLPILGNDQDIEPKVMKKANQFVSFIFGAILSLDIRIFLGGATISTLFSKPTRLTRQKYFFPLNRLTLERNRATKKPSV